MLRILLGLVVTAAGLPLMAGDAPCPSTLSDQQVATLAPASKNIVETAQSAGQFTTLLKAAKAAGLAETLAGDGPYTVFAPTDEAFAKLPKGALEGLLKDKAKLKTVLLYHVVKGKVTAKQVMEMDSAKTLAGQSVPVEVDGGIVMIGDAKVVKADIMASNGIIHVIDAVLMPEAE